MVGKPTNAPGDDSHNRTRRDVIRQADEELLATLGYKQEFRREFTPLEVSPDLMLEALTVICFLPISGVWNCILNYWFIALHSICLILRYTKWRRTSDGLGRMLTSNTPAF
jgi:hypothetical protein